LYQKLEMIGRKRDFSGIFNIEDVTSQIYKQSMIAKQESTSFKILKTGKKERKEAKSGALAEKA
jgi:hypothetical protein